MDKYIDLFNHTQTGPPDVERPIPVAVEPGPILVVTDGRSGADPAFLAAAFLAGRTGAEVRVVSVVEPAAQGDERRGVSARGVSDREVTRHHLVDAQLRRTVGEDAGWRVTVSAGSLGPAVRFATGTDTRLIILGRQWWHAGSGEEGSAAALRILAATNVPVYVVMREALGIPSRAVVAIDFGAASLRAARMVSDLIAPGGTIYLVHVTPLTTRESTTGTLTAGEPSIEDTRALLDQIGRSLRPAGEVRVRSIVLYGHASTELLAFADGICADLVACGASSVVPQWGTTSAHPRISPVAAAVLHDAACPILVAPAPSSPQEGVPQ